jgi:hypothetical protein
METIAGRSLLPGEPTVVGRPIRTPKAVFGTASFSQKPEEATITIFGIDASRLPERVVKSSATGPGGAVYNQTTMEKSPFHPKGDPA